MAATLLVQLTVLLAVMGAVFVDARSGNEGIRRSRALEERLLVEWASRVVSADLEAFCREVDIVEETAILSPERGIFSIGKPSRERTPAETAAFREEVASMASRARARDREARPLREGYAVLLPGAGGADPTRTAESRYIRFRPREADFGALRVVYLALLLGAAASMAVTVLALRFWILHPLHEVAAGAERVGRGDFSTPVPVHEGSRDEIAEVAAAFNSMMAELGAYRRDLEEQVGTSVRKARAAEQNLVTAQRLAAMGTLAAGIAHDINNPLGGMINAVRALRRDDLPPAKRLEYLSLVEEGLERVGHTVQKVLQFTPHRVAPQACDMAAVTERALALARHRFETAGVAAEVETPADGLPVFGDPWELQQVVLNLLVNSVDAVMERNRGSGRTGGRVRIRGAVIGADVRLQVEDDGAGMTEEQVARAFDLFYTTKDVGEGTGLGLSMVHSTIQSHGGRVEIRSKKGEGTTVEVVLPVYR